MTDDMNDEEMLNDLNERMKLLMDSMTEIVGVAAALMDREMMLLDIDTGETAVGNKDQCLQLCLTIANPDSDEGIVDIGYVLNETMVRGLQGALLALYGRTALTQLVGYCTEVLRDGRNEIADGFWVKDYGHDDDD